mgnify:CR=1 FL=1
MEVIVGDSAQDAACLAARLVAAQVADKPDSVLGLATGRTMEPVYACLVRFHRAAGLDFSRVRTFNLDEYVGVPSDHSESYQSFMQEHFFGNVNLNPANCRLPDGMAEDIPGECLRYEEAIRACGGIDLQLLGIGRSGHIGFNEPTSSLASRTRIKTLTRETVEQNSRFFGGPDKMPRHALTMGVGTILEARRCVMVVTGSEKARVLAQAVEGPVTSMVTASALQWHPDCSVVVDPEASTELTLADYYRWVYEHKPDWQHREWTGDRS